MTPCPNVFRPAHACPNCSSGTTSPARTALASAQPMVDKIEMLRVECRAQEIEARRAGRVADEVEWQLLSRNVGRILG